MTPFNPLECPLEGVRLIEAGAGTGKTWNISRLALRLVVEKGLRVDRILIVTFTEAATAEIRERLRSLLRSARDIAALKRPPAAGEEDIRVLIERAGSGVLARARLNAALHDFDSAPVCTIHGFCLRLLTERPFESSSPFQSGLMDETQKKSLENEVARDFFSTEIACAPLLSAEFASRALGDPASCLDSFKGVLSRQGVIPLDSPAPPDLEECRARCESLFTSLSTAWPSGEKALCAVLLGPDSPLKGNLYHRETSRVLLARAGRYFGAGGLHFPPDTAEFRKLGAKKLFASLRKGQSLPESPVFSALDVFLDAIDLLSGRLEAWLNHLRAAFPVYCRERGRAARRAARTRSFDDLLLDLAEALGKPSAGALKSAVRGKYQAALIDEFQDTDPVQYLIFSSFFGPGGPPLFLIGDPKQAVYGFRGADIQTYLSAARRVPEEARHTLTGNFRTEPGLLSAVNSLFLRPAAPFLLEGIGYREAEFPANSPATEKALLLDGTPSSQLVIWRPGPGEKGPLPAAVARDRICAGVAAEILALLEKGASGGACLGAGKLAASSIAVLVRSHHEARMVKSALASLNIPAVLHFSGNLFDTAEALEMLRILEALEKSSDDRRIRAALSTGLLGMTGNELQALQADPEAWTDLAGRFARLAGLFHYSGFMAMFRELSAVFNIPVRLLALPEGERRLTNLMHLAEILHNESAGARSGLPELTLFLARALHPDTLRSEEHELRLERDDDAVAIVTIHKAKGLEYPVVFCPFMWAASGVRDNACLFHDPADPSRFLYDPAGDANPASLRLAGAEGFSEALRLLYVAMTRAESRLYIVAGDINGYRRSALGYLLHAEGKRAGSTPADLLDAFFARMDALDADAMENEIRALAAESDGKILRADLPVPATAPFRPPQDKGEEIREPRPFNGIIQEGRRITSFSSLSRSPEGEHEKDRDNRSRASAEIPASPDLPPGARTGLFLHSLFEEADFSLPEVAEMEKLACRLLPAYGLKRESARAAAALALQTLSCPLDRESPPLVLSGIGAGDRLHEVEFHYPLRRISPESLSALSPGSSLFGMTADKLDFQPLRGYMRGFIDMIFLHRGRYFLLDWKSNLLPDYSTSALRAVMVEERYVLQYHIYALALDRFLASRIRDYRYADHFGGAYYLFVRGLDAAKGPDSGVFFDRPSPGLMDKLREELIG